AIVLFLRYARCHPSLTVMPLTLQAVPGSEVVIRFRGIVVVRLLRRAPASRGLGACAAGLGLAFALVLAVLARVLSLVGVIRGLALAARCRTRATGPLRGLVLRSAERR